MSIKKMEKNGKWKMVRCSLLVVRWFFGLWSLEITDYELRITNYEL
jgi:hypothetical protein